MTAIRVELELADGTFTTRMLNAGETVARFNQNVARSSPALQALAAAGGSVVTNISLADKESKGFLSTMRDMSIVAGILSLGIGKIAGIQDSWIGSIIKTNAQLERMNFQMRSMSGAADPIKDAGDQVKYLRQASLDMPFTLKSITDGFVKLKSTGTDPLSGSLQSLADGVAAFGGSDEAFQRTILAVSQISGKGVLQMEELRQQLGESMPRAVELMARSMGVSMGQLIKDISSGTVAAKPALKAFYDELDRTYGGRAKMMMQTFEGQIKQTSTLLQQLATSDTMQKGFFADVKSQLGDINTFLSSKAAATLGDDIGRGLQTGVAALRSAVDWIIQFRNEIRRTAEVIAAGFAFSSAVSAISTVKNALTTLVLQLRATSVAMGALAEQRTLLNIMMNSGAPAMTVMGQRLTMLRTGLGGLMTGAAAVAPWIAALGLTAYVAGEYFGVFSNKVDEAYESLLKYGAETRKQAQETSDAKLKQLDEEIARETQRDAMRKQTLGSWVIDPAEPGKDLTSLNAQRNTILAAQAKLVEEAGDRQDAKDLDKFRSALARKLAVNQQAYDQQMNQAVKAADELQAEAAKNGSGMEDATRQRADSYLAIQKTLYADNIKVLQDAYDQQIALSRHSGEVERIEAQKRADDTLKQLNAQKIAFSELHSGQVALLDKPQNSEKAFQKGSDYLEKLNAEIKGMEAALNGANAEVVELQENIANGTFKTGDIGEEKVKALDAAIIAATKHKEVLDTLMKGKKSLDDDIERARLANVEKAAEIQEKSLGRQLTDSEKILIKLNAGGYAGYGPQGAIAKTLDGLMGKYDKMGNQVTQLAGVMQTNTFGDPTNNKIKTLNETLSSTVSIIGQIGQALGNVNFDNMQMAGDRMFGGNASKVTGASGTFLDMVGQKESGGDYNATLDNGKWTGQLNLVTMSLNQIVEAQKTMIANPENRAKYDGIGSSAMGKYQIVGSTLKGLMQELHLTGEELFNPAMQDKLASALVQRRSGQGVEGLRNEWTSLKNVDAATILNALGAQKYAPGQSAAAAAPATPQTYQPDAANAAELAARDEATKNYVKTLQTQIAAEKETNKGVDANKRADALKDLVAGAKAAQTDVDELHKHYAALVASIQKGDLGPNKNSGAPEYRALILAATEADRVENEVAIKQKARRQAESGAEKFTERKIELTKRLAEAQARAADPNEIKTSTAYRALRVELEDYVRDAERAYGKDTKAYRDAVAEKTGMLKTFATVESTEKAAGWAKSTRDITRSLGTERQQRYAAMQDQITQIDAAVAAFQGSEEQKVDFVRQAEAQKAAIRAQYAQQMNPMAKQLQEWGDIQGNLAKASTSWMSSIADGITGIITGTQTMKQALSSIVNGVLKDLVNMGVKYMMSSMMGGGTGTGGGLKGKLSSGAGATGGGAKKLLSGGVAHTGGMVGGSLPSRLVSANSWASAPRFHTGGIIGQDEVPIIAKKGEGVFTPEQMDHLGGFSSQQFMIQAPVTVHGSAGTPAQNDDLAKKMGRQMEATMRGLVADELRKAQRPGNIANRKNR